VIERIAFVSAPGGSTFMAELLDVVADSVDECGLATVRHTGSVTTLDDGCTAFVVIPHEYFAVAGPPPDAALSRTIGLCVEHPGTATFEASHQAASRLAARFDINAESQVEARRRGVSSERYELGYSKRWDRRMAVPERDVDVLYMGTADPRRLGILAQLAEPLQGLRTELFIPPHEPMTRTRLDFLLGADKWRLMARSRMLLNLHREAATAFEWVRALEAICNGAVVVSEPAADLAPFVPGEHLLVARPRQLGAVLAAAADDPQLLARLAASALTMTKTCLDPIGSARRLGDLALSLPSGRAHARPSPLRSSATGRAEPPLAEWAPTARALPTTVRPVSGHGLFVQRLLDDVHELASVGSRQRRPAATTADIDVVCVGAECDGPVSLTLDSLMTQGVAVHLAFDGVAVPPLGRWDTVRSVLHNPIPVGRARCRNELFELGSAPFVLVIDAGDELLDGTLGQLVDALRADRELDLALTMARHGTGGLVNVFVPEARRLRKFSYLTRGYLARRDWLVKLGGFTRARTLQELVDHDFWCRSAAAGAQVRLQRRIGFALWPKRTIAGDDDREYGAAAELLRETPSA
jgi:hypothetical protein